MGTRSGAAVVLACVAVWGCLDVFGGSVRVFPEARTYVRPLFETAEACEEARSRGVINCRQWVEFCPDGAVTVVVTDIINGGSYEVRGRRVVLAMDRRTDVPDRLEFELSDDEERLTRGSDGSVWSRSEDVTPPCD